MAACSCCSPVLRAQPATETAPSVPAAILIKSLRLNRYHRLSDSRGEDKPNDMNRSKILLSGRAVVPVQHQPSCCRPLRRVWLLGAIGSILIPLSALAWGQAGGAAAPKPDRPIRATVLGSTKLWVLDQPVAETDRDELFQTERWGPAFSYRFSDVPPGPCTVRLGFNENKWTARGERVFDILINGEVVFPRFDILEHGMPNEAVIVATTALVPVSGELEIAFKAIVDNAKINLIRLCGENWVAETSPVQEDRARFLKPEPEAAWMLKVHETSLGRFGSRFAVNPRPQKGLMVGGPMGHADYNVAYFEKTPELYEDTPLNYYFTVTAGGQQYGLPFNPDVPVFPAIEQCQGMTWLEYQAGSPDLPVAATFRFDAPFYPQDLKASCAPYLRLRVKLENLTGRKVDVRLVVGREQRPSDQVGSARLAGWKGLLFRSPVFGLSSDWYWLAPEKWAPGRVASSAHITGVRVDTNPSSFQTDREGRVVLPVLWDRPLCGLEATVTLDPFAVVEVPLLWVAWVQEPVLEALGKRYRFVYTRLFADPEEVVRYAEESREDLERRVDVFERTVTDATLPQSLKNFLAFAFQSWVMNTWYLTDEAGHDWFSVWEGCCKFHSTVDVEYNVAPLYFQYWPDLMKLTLQEWAPRITNGILPHDMGMGLRADGMDYGHHMEVEENTNFVLLLHQYWRHTGDETLVGEMLDKVSELLEYVIDADTDGDGFVEKGTFNTIDQGSAAIQSAPDQMYLAVRSLAAFKAGAEMALFIGRQDAAARWREQAALIARTIDSEGWKDDHYVVNLNQQTPVLAAGADPPQQESADGPPPANAPLSQGPGDRLSGQAGRGGYGVYGGDNQRGDNWNTWKGHVTPSGPPSGWDSYSIYTTNGLLYPLRSGMALPELNLERLRIDLGRAAAETLRQYGSPHTSHENNLWVSQNIWRDAAAAYLGIDLIGNIDRYWALQLLINRTKRGCFTDVYNYGAGSISLDYYPRGVAGFALVPALGGVSLDMPAGRLSVAALRSPLRLPLTALADWKMGEVPWLVLERTGLDTRARIEGRTRVPVRLESRPFGEPW